MTETFDLSVLIGRFEPYHMGHAALLNKALEVGHRTIVLLGSAFQAPSPRNPFSAEEREAMIRSTLSTEESGKIQFLYQRDYWCSSKWAQEAQRAIHAAAPTAHQIALVGHHKDNSSAYLDLFPHWSYIGAGSQGDVDATTIRHAIFENDLQAVEHLLPQSVYAWIASWMQQDICAELREDYFALSEYQKHWGLGPFVTTDALVEALGHVLLIRRGKRPGKKQLALPGGFLELHESIVEGALRELREETGLDLSGTDAKPCASRLFAHPGRSLRARIITHAEHFRISVRELPKVSGSDDAAEAFWIPIQQLATMEDQFFEDHFHILDQFLHLTDTQS